VLKNFLETDMKGQMVNLICHSLGGLDARYMVSVIGSTQVASITTIGTPHQGTPLADWAVKQKNHRRPWYWFFRMLGYDMDQRRFLPELTTEYMRDTFNPKVLNSPDVRYFSVRTKASFEMGNMSYLLWFTARWLESENNPLAANGHDGLVPYDSEGWGRVIAEANLDHLAQINHHEWRYEDQSQQVFQIYSQIYGNLSKEGL
jgi:triacylglycerol lipase